MTQKEAKPSAALELSDLEQVKGGAVGFNYQQGQLLNITLFTSQDEFFWNSTAKDDALTLYSECKKKQKSGPVDTNHYLQLIKTAEVTTWDGKKVDTAYREKVAFEFQQLLKKM